MDIFATFDAIGLSSLKEYLNQKQEENLFIEFKTINTPELDKSDRKNFAKALSGFANSSGGLIIWGIEARKNQDGVDCASAEQPVSQLSLLISRLNQLTGEMVNPSVDGTRHKLIEIRKDEGFAVTLVPVSDSGPHMAKGGEDRYYKRSGDSFYRMEHFDIEDMFGRRKKPRLTLVPKIVPTSRSTSAEGPVCSLSVLMGIENSGRGSAKSPFLEVRVRPPYTIYEYGIDGNKHFGLTRLVQSEGSKVEKYGASGDVVIHPGTTHDVTAVLVKVQQGNPNTSDLIVDYKIAAEDMRLVEDKLTASVGFSSPTVGVAKIASDRVLATPS